MEQEKAANFRLQPLPDVFESLLSPNGGQSDAAVSETAQTEAASMDEDEVDVFKPTVSTQNSSGAPSPDKPASSPSLATDSLNPAESPDAAATGQSYGPLPTENLKFAFLGGSYR